MKSKKVTPKEGHTQFLTMSVFNVDNFHEGMPSEPALFDLPPTQVAVSDIYYQEVRPLSQLSGDSPIELESVDKILWTI